MIILCMFVCVCVQLIITVQDRNDNKPEFETSQYLKTVREDLPVHSSVTEGGYRRACSYIRDPLVGEPWAINGSLFLSL